MEKVTIIIPVYNCEKFITQTIESVKKKHIQIGNL